MLLLQKLIVAGQDRVLLRQFIHFVLEGLFLQIFLEDLVLYHKVFLLNLRFIS